MKTEVFKAYDIRGQLGEEGISPALMHRVAQAFAQKEKATAVILGRDIRHSSEELASAFSAGLLSSGKKVLNLGLTTTDLLYYASVKKDLPAAIITASHNPANYNGVKLCHRRGKSLSSAEIKDLDQHFKAAKPKVSSSVGVRDLDLSQDYLQHLLTTLIEVQKIKPLKVAIDGGNGMVGLLAERLFAKLPCQLSGIFLEPDGDFPNHPADPSKAENLRDLQNLVKAKEADIGIAFDGDADRAVFVDSQGEVVNGSKTLILIARWLLQRAPAADNRIVYDSISSQTVVEAIEKYGGVAIKSPVGTPFIKKTMTKHKALFGGETSGHCYFRDNFQIDSGLFTTLVMLQTISESQRSLADLQQEIKLHPHSGEIIFAVQTKPENVLKALAEHFAKDGAAKINHFDGLEVRWQKVWFNLRISNTEPIIRLNIEGKSPADIQALSPSLRKLIKDSNQLL